MLAVGGCRLVVGLAVGGLLLAVCAVSGRRSWRIARMAVCAVGGLCGWRFARLEVGCWRLAVAGWWLVVGLAVGGWLFAAGGLRG